MSVTTAVRQLAEVENSRQSGTLEPERILAIAVSRLGSPTQQRMVCGTLSELNEKGGEDPSIFGEPLHSLIIVGKRLHHLEVEFAAEWAINKDRWYRVARDKYGVKMDD